MEFEFKTDLTINKLIELHLGNSLRPDHEYQRGPVWTNLQKQKLIDSVLRDYALPMFYIHVQLKPGLEGNTTDSRLVDGQQRINALVDFFKGEFKLLDPTNVKYRFPKFIREQSCEWGDKTYDQLPQILREKFLNTPVVIALVRNAEPNEVRDLFVRLQAGTPLNSQEKRDSIPGELPEFLKRLAGDRNHKHSGHDFFSQLCGRTKTDRGQKRQLAAQICMLLLEIKDHNKLVPISAKEINDFYFEQLDFDENSKEYLRKIFDRCFQALPSIEPKLEGHEAISIALLVQLLTENFAKGWEGKFSSAYLDFRLKRLEAQKTKSATDPYWSQYGIWTQTQSHSEHAIATRFSFLTQKMLEQLQPTPIDPKRGFSDVDRQISYLKYGRKCFVCESDLPFSQLHVHHVVEHQNGGLTNLENAVPVHQSCHPLTPEQLENTRQKFFNPTNLEEGFSVHFPDDDHTIFESTAVDTFMGAITYRFFDQIRNLKIEKYGHPFISTTPIHKPYSYKQFGDWYITTQFNNLDKKRMLIKIFEQLGVSIEIKLFK